MLEFGGFMVAAAGVLYVQNRWGGRNSERKVIEKVFRNVGIGMGDRKKDGSLAELRFPSFKSKEHESWGTTYSFKLPIGMSYRIISETKPLDIILEDTLNKDVEIEDGKWNVLKIKIYKKRLPEEVHYKLEWLEECKGYRVVVGVDHHGLVFHDFGYIPHMICGGMTRYGKSVLLKLLITQLVLASPLLKLHLFDLKGGLAFNRFKKLSQVHSVSRDVKESLSNLKTLKGQIIKRQKFFEKMGFEDIGEADKAGYFFEREIIIIDEASVLAPQSKSDQERIEIKGILEYIAQVAGGLGYNLIMCSQYPTGDILPRQVKQNSDARLSFRLPTGTASNVILDEGGAEEIPYGLRGRAIYKTDLKKTIQVPWLKNEVIDKLLEPLKVEVINDDEQGVSEVAGGTDHTEPGQYGDGIAEPTTINPFFRLE